MKIIIYSVLFIFLALNFKSNVWKGCNFFEGFQYDSESLVVGRLLQSQKLGLFDEAGLLGWVHSVSPNPNKFVYQYEASLYDHPFDSYEAYYSQSGGQAFLYGLICRITGLKGNAALQTLWWLVSYSTALAFVLFIYWVQRRWGWATALFVFITIVFSQWITAFGRNLFYLLGAFYLPFIVSLWFLQNHETKARNPLRTVFLLMFVTMLIKCLLTGFDFITPALVMSVTPWVFYAIMNQWTWKKFLQHASTASAGVLAATVTAILLLALQLSVVKGSVGEGFDYILWTFGKRTYGGGGGDYASVFTQSFDSSLWNVLVTYCKGYAFDITHWFDGPFWKMTARVSYGYCILTFALISIIVVFSTTLRQYPVFRRQQLALAAMLWTSILAPLSWFVIFKGHSYLHTHMNFIIWHMPFMLLGAAFTGSTLWFFIKSLHKTKTQTTDENQNPQNEKTDLPTPPLQK